MNVLLAKLSDKATGADATTRKQLVSALHKLAASLEDPLGTYTRFSLAVRYPPRLKQLSDEKRKATSSHDS